MKCKMKYEIADAAGMSRRTFQRWMKVHREELRRLGVTPCQKLLSPKVVRYICRELGVDEF